MKKLFAALFVLALAAPALAFEGKCLIRVGGKNYLKGRCEIELLDKDGSFTVGASDKAPSDYFAYVTVMSPGVADGSWNRDPKATHAHAPLGVLKRQGACWVNDNAKVCATR